jgi:hypothetical protein
MKTGIQISKNETPKMPDGKTLQVVGRVRQPLVLSVKELCRMECEQISDLPIYCGTGTPKGAIVNCKGILLENVIRMADVIKSEHNDTKKMFIVAWGHDGHKVVFSWQEIFNTPIGGGVMILIEKDGKSLCQENSDLELISAEDYYTGSRYVKGLEKIEVVLAA